jgi:hypothetical protein
VKPYTQVAGELFCCFANVLDLLPHIAVFATARRASDPGAGRRHVHRLRTGPDLRHVSRSGANCPEPAVRSGDSCFPCPGAAGHGCGCGRRGVELCVLACRDEGAVSIEAGTLTVSCVELTNVAASVCVPNITAVAGVKLVPVIVTITAVVEPATAVDGASEVMPGAGFRRVRGIFNPHMLRPWVAARRVRLG